MTPRAPRVYRDNVKRAIKRNLGFTPEPFRAWLLAEIVKYCEKSRKALKSGDFAPTSPATRHGSGQA